MAYLPVFLNERRLLFYTFPRFIGLLRKKSNKIILKIIQNQYFTFLRDFDFNFERFLAGGNPIINYSFRSDRTGFTVAALKLRKVTTATVTPKTASSANANTHQYSGT